MNSTGIDGLSPGYSLDEGMCEAMDSNDDFSPDASPLLAYLAVLRDQPSGDSMAYSMTRGLLAPYGGDMAMVYAARPHDDRSLDLVGSYGLGPRTASAYGVVSADMHLPGAETYRTGIEKFMAAKHVAEEYPLSAPFYRDLPPSGDIGFIPLVHRGAPIGFLVLTFVGPVDRTWQLRATLQGLTDATTLWVLADRAIHGDARALTGGPPPLELTARQREVLVRIRTGEATRDIAAALGYSLATIKGDIAALSGMVGAKGRSDLLIKAKRAGL
ncbi:MAG: helix-turn-helix transcriptional regulator [Candidatus Nanopelagicales bacterium]|nr:helix-turn-helix transcriptional regulator [Candidatus Nanopelagicales bacterium]MDP4715623.1 helix-turn-helix transcriptional regulator [Candidatus Nanopelagicales bacterium]